VSADVAAALALLMQRLAATEAQWRAEKARAERAVAERDDVMGVTEAFKHERDESRAEVERLRSDILRGLRVANQLTLETQTVEDACVDLVRQVRDSRAEVERLRLRAAKADWYAERYAEYKAEAARLRALVDDPWLKETERLDAAMAKLARAREALRGVMYLMGEVDPRLSGSVAVAAARAVLAEETK
jgi:chromosome segregation ATPase